MPHRRDDSPFWWISYTNAGGKRVRESSGTEDHGAAKALEAERRAQVHRVTKWGDTPDRTIDELLLEYLSDEDNAAIDSHDRDKYSAARIKDAWSGRGVMTLRAADVEAYIKKRRKDPVKGRKKAGVKGATITRELQLVSRAISWANTRKDWGLPNPIAKRAPRAEDPDLKWLTKAQVALLLEAAGKLSRAAHLEDFIELGVHTGMRKSEMLGLEWSRVDFDGGIIIFGRDDQKKGVPGSIPMNETARAVLARVRAKFEIGQARRRGRGNKLHPDRYVFTNRFGGRMDSVKDSFAKAAEAAGMPEVTPHWLRHTFASWLVQKGVPLAKVKDLCRHEDIRTTQRYAHLAPKDTHDAVHVLDGMTSKPLAAETSPSRFGHVGEEREKNPA